MLWKWLRFAELVIKCAQFLTVEDSDPILDVDWRQGVFWNDVSISNSSQIFLPISFAIDLKCIMPGYTAAPRARCYTECIRACVICLGRNPHWLHFPPCEWVPFFLGGILGLPGCGLASSKCILRYMAYCSMSHTTNAGSWKQKTRSLWLRAICGLWCRHRKHPGHRSYS